MPARRSHRRIRVEPATGPNLTEEERTERRRCIIAAHARWGQTGPMLCIPSKTELEAAEKYDRRAKHAGKVIYDTKASADMAAAQFLAIGDPRQESYQCERSKHGHQHLRTVR